MPPLVLPPPPDGYRSESFVCARCDATTPAAVVGGLAFCHCDFASDPESPDDADPPHGARRRDRFYPETLAEFPELAWRTALQARALGWKRRPAPRWGRWRGLQLTRSTRKRLAVLDQPHPQWRQLHAQQSELAFGDKLADAYWARWRGKPATTHGGALELLREVAQELEKLDPTDLLAAAWLERWGMSPPRG